MSRYTADRIFLNSNIAPFGEMNTICWVRPDYVLQLVNIPVGVILLSNLTVIIAAVATAYRSATFRWKTINRGNNCNRVKSFFQEYKTLKPCEKFLKGIQNIATVRKASSRNTTTFVKLTGAARNCVTLSATLGLGFLVSFPILRLVFQYILSQVGFIPCNVSNFIEPYTFTIVNGLSGVKLDFFVKVGRTVSIIFISWPQISGVFILLCDSVRKDKKEMLVKLLHKTKSTIMFTNADSNVRVPPSFVNRDKRM